MDNYLIMLAGLPGTGKTAVTTKLTRNLENYVLIEQMKVREELNETPYSQDETLRTIDRRTLSNLLNNKGVIIDSINKFIVRRHQIYGIASCAGVDAITLECICPESVAKERMSKRKPGLENFPDPNDTKVYDKAVEVWENVKDDFKIKSIGHVSYVIYDSFKNSFNINVKADNSRDIKKLDFFLEELGNILVS